MFGYRLSNNGVAKFFNVGYTQKMYPLIFLLANRKGMINNLLQDTATNYLPSHHPLNVPGKSGGF